MHPRNPYKDSPDFSSLAEFFPPLKLFVTISSSGKHHIDFTEPLAQRALTQALLKRDFNLTMSLPDNRLCPPIPNRLNYVLWIQDILFPFTDTAPCQSIRGLDIGTGASAIYPLLACSLPHPARWNFVGTEIDSLSAGSASRNVEANNLQSRITIWPIQPNSPVSCPTPEQEPKQPPILAPLMGDSGSRFDFTMCNPPFYGSSSEIDNSAEAKELPPNSVCTGADTEMITPGGETAFVLQMVRESARDDVRGRCRWFTSMLGKLRSVGEVVGELRNRKMDNYALTQFVQGTTRRWAVAWSFGDERLPDTVGRPSSSSLSSYLPAPTTLRQTFSTHVHPTNLSSLKVALPTLHHQPLKSILSQILASIQGVLFHDVRKSGDEVLWRFDISASENTWSRAARRKRKRTVSPTTDRPGKTPRLETASPTAPVLRHDQDTITTAPVISPTPALQCWISLLPTKRCTKLGTHCLILETQWTRGKDRALFESFWSHVCRKVRDEVEGPTAKEGNTSTG